MSASAQPPAPSLEIRSAGEWRMWLEQNHDAGQGLWLITFRKKAGAPHVPYVAVVEEALCFGWVDSLPRKLDERRTMLWLSPRKSGSGWSRVNKEHVVRLTEAGRMHPAGLAKIGAARQDGSWTLLDSAGRLEIPDDLALAFEQHPGSAANFAAFPPSARRGILEWIALAKKPATRVQRLARTASMATSNQRANSWKPQS